MASFFRTACRLALCLGCLTPALAEEADDKTQAKVEFRRAETEPAEGLIEARVLGTMDKVYLHKSSEATGEDIMEARLTEDENMGLAIQIIFTKDGAKKMAKLSQEHKDKPLAVMVNGKVISAPRVITKFSEKALIVGKFTKQEAEKLVKSINGK